MLSEEVVKHHVELKGDVKSDHGDSQQKVLLFLFCLVL
jgi:hypothetical protein